MGFKLLRPLFLRSDYYKYPRSVWSKYIIQNGLDRHLIKFRESWIRQTKKQTNSSFHKFVLKFVIDDSYLVILHDIITEHGIFFEKYFHNRTKSMVLRKLLDCNIPLERLQEIANKSLDSKNSFYNHHEAVFRVIDYVLDFLIIENINDAKIRGAAEIWFSSNEKNRSCAVCGKTFRLIDLPDFIYFGSDGFRDCCFQCPIEVHPKKADLPPLVSKFIDSCGFIPNSNAHPTEYTFSTRVDKKNYLSAITDFAHMGGISTVISKYGSWFKALSQIGVLPKGVLVTARGVKCLSKSGNVCLSLDEQLIDNWLYTHGIDFKKEPKYPYHGIFNPKGTRRGDWKIGDVFVEYFGLVGDPKYDKIIQEKLMLAKSFDFGLIEIYPSDLNNLDKVFSEFLK